MRTPQAKFPVSDGSYPRFNSLSLILSNCCMPLVNFQSPKWLFWHNCRLLLLLFGDRNCQAPHSAIFQTVNFRLLLYLPFFLPFLFLGLDNFYCSTVKFTYYFVRHLKYAGDSIQCIFLLILVLSFSKLKIPLSSIPYFKFSIGIHHLLHNCYYIFL